MKASLLAQLAERCTGITEVMGSNPVQAWFFSRHLNFHYCSSSVLTTKIAFMIVS